MNVLKMNYIDELVYFRKRFMLNCNFIERMREKEIITVFMLLWKSCWYIKCKKPPRKYKLHCVNKDKNNTNKSVRMLVLKNSYSSTVWTNHDSLEDPEGCLRVNTGIRQTVSTISPRIYHTFSWRTLFFVQPSNFMLTGLIQKQLNIKGLYR